MNKRYTPPPIPPSPINILNPIPFSLSLFLSFGEGGSLFSLLHFIYPSI